MAICIDIHDCMIGGIECSLCNLHFGISIFAVSTLDTSLASSHARDWMWPISTNGSRTTVYSYTPSFDIHEYSRLLPTHDHLSYLNSLSASRGSGLVRRYVGCVSLSILWVDTCPSSTKDLN